MLTKRVAGLVLCVFCVASACAEEAKSKKPLGSWERKAGDKTIQFHFKNDALSVVLKEGGNGLQVDSDYGVTKDGVVYGIVTGVKKDGVDGGPQEGHLFSFRVAVDKDTLTIKEINGSEKPSEEAKQLIEGEYKKVGK